MNIKFQWFKWILWVVVLFLVNSAASTLFFRKDLTRSGIHTLSNASVNVVSTLEEPLTIKVFLSENLPSPYNNLEQEISDLLEAYSLKGNKFFNYTIANISSEVDESEISQSNRADAQSYGIHPIQIQKVESDEVQLVSVFMGIVFIHGDMIETIPLVGGNDNKEVLITSTIQKMSDKTGALLALEHDIQIKLYLSSSLGEASAELKNYEAPLHEEINSLNSQYYGRLNFISIDPENLVAGEKSPEEYNLNSLNLQIEKQGERVNRKVYASLVVENDSVSRNIDILKRGFFGNYEVETPSNLLASLPGIVDTLVGINQKIGYLSDHGTLSLNTSGNQNEPQLNNFRNLLYENNYDLIPLNLDEGIPEDISTLLVVSPREKFSDWELFQLDQFLMKGNTLAFFMDSMLEITQESQNPYYAQPPVYQPRETGLDPLLKHYGFTVEKSYIMDENCFKQTNRTQDNGLAETLFYFAPFIESDTINAVSPVMGNIKRLLLLNASPLVVNKESASGLVPEVLFSSSSQSWEMKDEINLYNPTTIYPPSADVRDSHDAAAFASGVINSYFKGKTVPSPPQEPDSPQDAEDVDAQDTETKKVAFTAEQVSSENTLLESGEGKIFVTGSSTVLIDNLVDPEGNSSNSVFVLNLMDVLSNREDYARMRSKGQTFSPLTETSAALKRFIKTFNIAGLPVIIILFGIFIWLRYLARKRRIELLFTGEGGK